MKSYVLIYYSLTDIILQIQQHYKVKLSEGVKKYFVSFFVQIIQFFVKLFSSQKGGGMWGLAWPEKFENHWVTNLC